MRISDATKIPKMLSAKALLIILPLLILVGGIATFALAYASEDPKIKDVVITNVTYNSATVTWETETPVKGRVVVSKASENSFPDLLQKAFNSYLRSEDDRNIEQIETDNIIEYSYNSEIAKDRTIHHVSIRGLEPSTEYVFQIDGSLKTFSSSDYKFTTLENPISIQDPKTVYGDVQVVYVDKGGIPQQIVAEDIDGVVIYSVEGGFDTKVMSTIIGSDAKWTADISYPYGVYQQNSNEDTIPEFSATVKTQAGKAGISTNDFISPVGGVAQIDTVSVIVEQGSNISDDVSVSAPTSTRGTGGSCTTTSQCSTGLTCCSCGKCSAPGGSCENICKNSNLNQEPRYNCYYLEDNKCNERQIPLSTSCQYQSRSACEANIKKDVGQSCSDNSQCKSNLCCNGTGCNGLCAAPGGTCDNFCKPVGSNIECFSANRGNDGRYSCARTDDRLSGNLNECQLGDFKFFSDCNNYSISQNKLIDDAKIIPAITCYKFDQIQNKCIGDSSSTLACNNTERPNSALLFPDENTCIENNKCFYVDSNTSCEEKFGNECIYGAGGESTPQNFGTLNACIEYIRDNNFACYVPKSLSQSQSNQDGREEDKCERKLFQTGNGIFGCGANGGLRNTFLPSNEGKKMCESFATNELANLDYELTCYQLNTVSNPSSCTRVVHKLRKENINDQAKTCESYQRDSYKFQTDCNNAAERYVCAPGDCSCGENIGVRNSNNTQQYCDTLGGQPRLDCSLDAAKMLVFPDGIDPYQFANTDTGQDGIFRMEYLQSPGRASLETNIDGNNIFLEFTCIGNNTWRVDQEDIETALERLNLQIQIPVKPPTPSSRNSEIEQQEFSIFNTVSAQPLGPETITPDLLNRGVYKLDIEGYGSAEFTIYADGIKVQYFEDTNGDGIKQENEPFIDLSQYQIQISKQQELKPYTFNTGWNSVTFNIINENLETASEVVTALSAQGIRVEQISRFDKGQWLHFVVEPTASGVNSTYGTDFKIIPGQGYFIRTLNQGTAYLTGNTFESSVPIALESGWNLIGVQSPTDYTANQFLDICNSQNASCVNISRYDQGVYDSVVIDNGVFFGNNFEIKDSEGYFLLNEGGGVTIRP